MATRQYIGARYVPKFYQNSVDGSTQWENNVVYDPLIYVTLQNGHMYISKKTVPATVGSPAQNIDYWLDVGSYDGYIEDLQNQINAMKNGNVSGSLQNQINTINDTIDALDDRHFLCVSDSYAENPSTTSSWVEKFAAVVGSANVTKAYKGGYGFQPASYTAPFKNLITPGSVDTGVPSNYDTTKVTDIIVLGGFNDRSTPEATILSAIQQFCTYARSTYSNLKRIYIGAVGWSMNSEYISELNHGNYMCAYKRCGEYGAIYLAGIENVMHSFDLFKQDPRGSGVSVLSYNYVHPNDDGSKYIAEYLYSALFGGSADVQYGHKVVTLNCVSNIKNGSSTTVGLVERVYGDMVKIGWGNMNINHADNSAFSIGATTGVIEIATIDQGYYNGADNAAYIPCKAFIAGGNVTSNHEIGAWMVVYNGKLSLYYNTMDGTTYAPTLIYIYASEGYTALIP